MAGPTFGTSRSLFDIKDHGIQESEMVPVDAYDVATLAHCKDYASMEEVGRPVHPKGVTTDGLLTVSPQHFGIKTFTSNADYSAESPAGIRSPDRAGRPVGFDMMMEQTHPQQRSPRQHRRDLNMERGPETHDEKHRMARSIASFRDIVPSTILEVTANYQEFYPAAKEMTTAASRAAALPFVVTNNSLIAPGNTKLPSVYYMGDGVFAQHDDLAKSKEAAETNGELPKLPSLTTFAPPVFCVNGAAVPSTAVAVRHMVRACERGLFVCFFARSCCLHPFELLLLLWCLLTSMHECAACEDGALESASFSPEKFSGTNRNADTGYSF